TFPGHFSPFRQSLFLGPNFLHKIGSRIVIPQPSPSFIPDEVISFRVFSVSVSKKDRSSKSCRFQNVVKSGRMKTSAYERKISISIYFRKQTDTVNNHHLNVKLISSCFTI